MAVLTKEYNGMFFHDLAVSTSPVKTEVAISVDDKLVNKGPLTLQRHEESYKFEPELMLSTWSTHYPVPESRGVYASPYWRTEHILCKISDFQKIREWRDYFFDFANALDCILKGIEV